MNRIERHVITKNHPMYEDCDKLCFLSKNMYSLCNYTIRQEFFSSGIIKSYGDLNKELKHTDAFNMFGIVSSLKSTSKTPKEYQLCYKCAKDVNDFIVAKKNGRPKNDF